ncbi:UDP-4-amino-4,6-dideoxy-N-acetyl-beta-L-altrosamine transaminase [Candidatus Zixiibacteriota bacterium]
MDLLAINGGTPVRSEFLPYGRQSIGEEDISEVVNVLRSDWLTTGPYVERFETAFAKQFGLKRTVAVSSGTAALHTATSTLGVGEGDEIIVPSLTFCATANCVLFHGATPVFADVDPDTLLIDPSSVEALITERTRAVITVDYAGHPCDYDRLTELCQRHAIALVDDASHALGARYHGRETGTLADLTTYSFHPVKHITSGEGGMVATRNEEWAAAMKRFRNHNISSESRQREIETTWRYDITGLGFNYRITDIQCALALNQLPRLPAWLERRRQIAGIYSRAFQEIDAVQPLAVAADIEHAWHLYVIQLELDQLTVDRGEVFRALRAEGIGVNVHYIPVHLHQWYRNHLGTAPGLCPVTEEAYERIISLPIFPLMTDSDVSDVITAVNKVTEAYRK